MCTSSSRRSNAILFPKLVYHVLVICPFRYHARARVYIVERPRMGSIPSSRGSRGLVATLLGTYSGPILGSLPTRRVLLLHGYIGELWGITGYHLLASDLLVVWKGSDLGSIGSGGSGGLGSTDPEVGVRRCTLYIYSRARVVAKWTNLLNNIYVFRK